MEDPVDGIAAGSEKPQPPSGSGVSQNQGEDISTEHQVDQTSSTDRNEAASKPTPPTNTLSASPTASGSPREPAAAADSADPKPVRLFGSGSVASASAGSAASAPSSAEPSAPSGPAADASVESGSHAASDPSGSAESDSARKSRGGADSRAAKRSRPATDRSSAKSDDAPSPAAAGAGSAAGDGDKPRKSRIKRLPRDAQGNAVSEADKSGSGRSKRDASSGSEQSSADSSGAGAGQAQPANKRSSKSGANRAKGRGAKRDETSGRGSADVVDPGSADGIDQSAAEEYDRRPDELPDRAIEGKPKTKEAAERAIVRKPRIGDSRPAPPDSAGADSAADGEVTAESDDGAEITADGGGRKRGGRGRNRRGGNRGKNSERGANSNDRSEGSTDGAKSDSAKVDGAKAGGAQAGEANRGGKGRKRGDRDAAAGSSPDAKTDTDTNAAADSAAKPQDDSVDQSDGSNAGGGRRNRRGGRGRGGNRGRKDSQPAEAKAKGRSGHGGGSGDPAKPVQGFTGDGAFELDDATLEARRGRTRNGKPLGRYFMAVHVRDDATQIAVLEGRQLTEHYVSRPSDDVTQIHGNIYLGRVQNVLPGMEAAFVDIGTPKNAVLYRGDVQYDPADIDQKGEPRIEQILKARQNIVCQVTKNPIAHKGARLTQEVSLPGRFVVLIPNSSTYGISKRLADEERKRLRNVLDEVKPPEHGVIVRTAAEGVTADEIQRDVLRLVEQWEQIKSLAGRSKGGSLLYREPDMALRVIREEFNKDYRAVVIDDRELYEEMKGYVESVMPALAERIQYFDESTESLPLFEQHHVHEQLMRAVDRKVWLPSGGSLIIEGTEALTVIDVNTGKNVGKSSLEETVYRNNLEAATEIARQLRLRDIGGIIVIDFIDMEVKKNRESVIKTFREALARDKTRTQVFDISELGLVEMTRKRIGEGLVESLSHHCDECEGRGVVLNAELLEEGAAPIASEAKAKAKAK